MTKYPMLSKRAHAFLEFWNPSHQLPAENEIEDCFQQNSQDLPEAFRHFFKSYSGVQYNTEPLPENSTPQTQFTKLSEQDSCLVRLDENADVWLWIGMCDSPLDLLLNGAGQLFLDGSTLFAERIEVLIEADAIIFQFKSASKPTYVVAGSLVLDSFETINQQSDLQRIHNASDCVQVWWENSELAVNWWSQQPGEKEETLLCYSHNREALVQFVSRLREIYKTPPVIFQEYPESDDEEIPLWK